jgi:hypothetical protein
MSNVVTKVILIRPFVFKDPEDGRNYQFAVGPQFMPFRMADAAHAEGAVQGDAPIETPATAEVEAEAEADEPAPTPKRIRKPKASRPASL